MMSLSVPDKLKHVRKLLNDWDEGKVDQPDDAGFKMILDEMTDVKVKDIRFETVSFGIDFNTYEQIQKLLLSEQIQKQKRDDYAQMLHPPPLFMKVMFNEAPFFNMISAKRKSKLKELDSYDDYKDVLSEFRSQGPSRLGVFSDDGVSVHSYDFELKVGLMLINTALHNVKQIAKSQDVHIQGGTFPAALFVSYDTINIALANCLIIRDHIISSLRFHDYMFRAGNNDVVPAPYRPNVCERQFFKDVSDYLMLKVVVEHEMQPRPDTQGKLVYHYLPNEINLSFDITPISKYDPFVRPHMQVGKSKGGKSKRVKRVKRVKRSKRSKTCKNRVHKRRN